jgi:hypothetical protein
MKKSLFSRDSGDDGTCSICVHGRQSNDETKVLCTKKGVVDASYHCRKYKYDPLKRVPHHAPTLPHFDKDDFSI